MMDEKWSFRSYDIHTEKSLILEDFHICGKAKNKMLVSVIYYCDLKTCEANKQH